MSGPFIFIATNRLKPGKLEAELYWGRPSLHELHMDLREVLKKIRPDFDLHAEGLRDAWERGEREEFLVEGIEPAIRYTEGKSIGIKR